MSKKGIIITLIVVAAVVVVIIAVGNKGQLSTEMNGEEVSSEQQKEESRGTETFDPEVPDKDVEVTKPKTQAEAAPGSEASLRIFEMTASEDGYNPGKIVVNEGDTVSIKLQGGDTAFDIGLPDMGLHQTVKPGEETKLEFQALTPGTFTYLCKDMCPGGEKIKGSLIVKEK